MNTTCSSCGWVFTVPDAAVGQTVSCRNCASLFQVPTPARPEPIPDFELSPGSESEISRRWKQASQEHFLGIDYGTCNSSMAWFNPKTGHAETLLNAEGEDKTPSVVYYGDKETLVGKCAEAVFENRSERKLIITAAKRDLAKSRVWMMGTKRITPVDVAAEVLRKLKRDAEEHHFHQPVRRAVLTCPAIFDEVEKHKLREASLRAGFENCELLEEPVAAAMAYAQAGINVGQSVLVYDLGGGTFDVAVLVREHGDSPFRLALEPRGDRIGGEDFDRCIYTYYDDLARKKFRAPICENGIDLQLLRTCRRFKENLSVSEKPIPLSWWWKGKGRLELKLARKVFDEMIRDHVERTVQLTFALREEAARASYAADSVILIGGSSRIPLIQRRLHETLLVEPRKWQKQDVAVALGAAYHANHLWGRKPSRSNHRPSPPSEDVFVLQYRRALEAVWKSGKITREDLDRLSRLANQLGIANESAARIECQVMGDLKEIVFGHQAMEIPLPSIPPQTHDDESPGPNKGDKDDRPSQRRRYDDEDDHEAGENDRPPRRRRNTNDDSGYGRRSEPHRGVLVMVLGIAALCGACPCAIIGWSLGAAALYMANADLAKMDIGVMDEAGRSTTTAGRVCAILGIALGVINAVLGCLMAVAR